MRVRLCRVHDAFCGDNRIADIRDRIESTIVRLSIIIRYYPRVRRRDKRYPDENTSPRYRRPRQL